MDVKYEIVNFPIRVPVGDFCWNHNNHAICDQFDACGGHPKCQINNFDLEYNKNGGVNKPEKCKSLVSK